MLKFVILLKLKKLRSKFYSKKNLQILHFILFFVFILSSFNNLSADNKYPKELANAQAFDGGLLLYDTLGNISYFIKPNLESSQDVITSWKGLTKSNSLGKPIGDFQIIDAMTISNDLLLIVHNFNKSYLQLYDSALNLVSSSEFPQDLTLNSYTLKIKRMNDSVLFLLHSGNLFRISIVNNFFEILRIATQIADFEIINYDNSTYIAILENHNNSGILRILDKFSVEKANARLNISSINEIEQIGNCIAIKSSYENSGSTLVNIFDLNTKKMLTSRYFESEINNIAFLSEHKNLKVFAINQNEGQYLLNIATISLPEVKYSYEQKKLPKQIFEPIKLQSIDNDIFLCFRNAILICDEYARIKLFDFVNLGNNYRNDFYLQKHNDNLIISSKYYSEIYGIQNNQFWWFNRFASTLWTYIIPILLFILLIIFIRLYTKEKHFFQEFINFPSAGAIIIINHKGELLIANKYAKELLALDQSILLGKPFESYCTAEFAKPILAFYKHYNEVKESISQRISLNKPDGTLEYIFNISPEWSITGKYEGAVIIAFNITEEIERKRLSNWAQLAHDMQTNLATIKLNAEQLKNQANPELATLIDRIYNQVLILQKRVRDIVTVGRSSNLEIIQTNSLDLLNEVAAEFDDSLFPDVEISISTEQFPIYCDKPKLVRALRNAIENGIKALPERKGKIMVSAFQDGRYFCFSIKDNGRGMDADVRNKMLTPYFTTSKDGTGFGIGTLIIQEVVELHSGSLDIKTQKDQGTELIIKIPTRLRKFIIS